MMNCSQADRLIQTAMDGRLSPAERARLDAHLTHCAGCRAAWDDYRRLGQAATDWARRPLLTDVPGDAFTAQVMAQIAREASQTPHRLSVLHPQYWGLGGLLLLALSYWTGPLLLAHVPPVLPPSLLPPPSTLSPDRIGLTLAGAWRDTLITWQTLTAHPAALPGWVPSALAVTLGLNGAFAWRARSQGRETATR